MTNTSSTNMAYNQLLGLADRSDALADLLLQSVQVAGFDQVIDFGPEEDYFAPGAAPRIANTANVDLAVIELDREGALRSVANVLLSRDYPNGLNVQLNSSYGTDAVRWLKWDIDRWNGGVFDVGEEGLIQLSTKGWTTNPDLTTEDDIVLPSGQELYTFMSPYPASLFKVLVAYHVLTMVDDNKLSLDEFYTYLTDQDETRTIRDWMEPMITYSDNASTRALLQLLHARGEVDAMNAEFRRLGLGTLQVNGTDPDTGGNWQPGQIHMSALDTARLMWLIDGAPDDYMLWRSPEGNPVTSAELSESSRAYLKDLLAQQGFNEALTTANFGTYQQGTEVVGPPNTLPGIPSLVPSRWIDPGDGSVTVDGIPYGQDVRYYNDTIAEVSFAHKTGLTYNYGSDAGIVESLPGKPYRHYIIAYLSNLGYRYADAAFADRTSYPLYDEVGGIAYTQSIPALGKAIDSLFSNPPPPSLSISGATPGQLEGNRGSTPYGFTISRSGDLNVSSSVAWAVAGSGANPANALDFAGGQLPSGVAVFAPGQATVSLIVNVVGDGMDEADEAFSVTLSSPTGASLSATASSATSQIQNDDLPAVTYTPSASADSVDEGNLLRIGLSTTNVAAGLPIYWRLGGSGITAADFIDGLLGGESVIGRDGQVAFTTTLAADAVVDPNEQLEVRFFRDAAFSQQVGSTLQVTIKEPSVGVITDGNDVITGSSAGETLTGVPAGSALRGRNTIDRLTGGGGDDLFVLGDGQGPYYNDGTSGLGTTDMALITDFHAGDRIQLYGTSGDYLLNAGFYAGSSGVRISLRAGTSLPQPGVGMAPLVGNEAIGFVQGASLASLNLSNPSQFLYLS